MEGAPALSSKFLVLPQGRVAPRVFDRKSGNDLGAMVKSGGGSVVVVSLDEQVLHGPATDSRKGGFRQSSGQSREVVAGLGRGNALVVDGSTSWMLTDTEIIEHCRSRIGGYKIPRQMAFVEDLPKSAMGKILKTEIRKIYREPNS